jgi:HSP20 family molecular chaperone IbpA
MSENKLANVESSSSLSREATRKNDQYIKGDAPAGAGNFQYREFAMAGYWRQFILSDAFDAEKAEASIKQGVMTLKIPKAEAAKPKRIQVAVH